jgi:methionyl aminopeptidase
LKIFFENLNKNFNTLPFAYRWCKNISNNIDISLKKLSFLGLIKHYPQLVEQGDFLVSQKEHTVIVNNDGCEVTTKL